METGWGIAGAKMMNFFLMTLLFVASTLANVIREEQDICFNIAGVNLCGDPSISGKRDEQNVCFHVGGVEICGDPSISGKRDQQNVCFHVGGVEICGDPSISGKRDEQNICFHVGGVEICGDPSISGKRDEKDKRILPCYYIDGVRTCIGIKREEDLNLAEIVTNIGNVIHVIDQFVGGAATKREEQDSVGCIIAGINMYFANSRVF
uniref:Uncharacterized protein n=1 Tax=Biomphalaria glabrata TaxID=6526 RepID=A0A2C9L1A5_BIOGL